jgi:hypothetical protein
MFDPSKLDTKKADALAVRRACERVKGWAKESIPEDLLSQVQRPQEQYDPR